MSTVFSVDLAFRSTGVNNIQAFERQLQGVQTAAKGAQGSMDGAAVGAKGFGAALGAALGPLLSVAAALGVVKAGLDTAFARSAAEQRIRNITDSTGEFNAAMAAAAQSAEKFGLSQTETTKALGDVYARLKGVGFGLQETVQIYEGFNVIAKQSGLAAEEASGAFFQLSQALGKGKLNGDEFVIVAERMPQLLDAIAQTTGKSRGELQAMAQDGKITSQVLYEALSGAAAAAGDLNGKLTTQQQAMNQLGQVADRLLNSIGQVFAPVVIAGAQALASAGQMLADWWDYIGGVVFPKVYQAIQPVINELQYAFKDFDFEPFRVFLQSILIKGFEVLTSVVAGFAKVLAQVINAFRALIQNPVFQFIAEQVGRLVNHLGLATDKVGEFKKEQEGTQQAAAETVKAYNGLPAPIEDSDKAAKKLKKAQEAVTQEIQKTVQEYEKQAQAQTTAVDQALSVTQARLQAEQAINQVLLDQAQRQLNAASTQKERVTAAKQIYDLTVRQAELEYQATNAAIQAELAKSRLALENAQLKAKELEAVVRLAQAQGTVTQAHYEALAAQRDAITMAGNLVNATENVARHQLKAAEAVYQGKVNAAAAAYQQNIVAKNTQAAASAAGQFAQNMAAGAAAAGSAADAVAQATYGVSGDRGTPGEQFGAAGRNAAFMSEYAEAFNKLQKEMLTMSISQAERASREMMDRFMKMAEEYNRKAAAESNRRAMEEWNKYMPGSVGSQAMRQAVERDDLGSAMNNYGASARSGGGGNTQVNINYQGSTVRMPDGNDYIKTSDTNGIVGQAVKQTISTLGRDPSARRAAGIA